MKITNIDVVLEDRPGFPPGTLWRKNIPGPDTSTTGAWLVIETDAGNLELSLFSIYVDEDNEQELLEVKV
jgi:hypothetical protein